MHVCSAPPELWLEIFKSVPQDSLPSVVSTNHVFAQLARPLLFSNFTFKPYGVQELNLYELPAEERQRTWDRLDFWSSKTIAPAVRSCTLEVRFLEDTSSLVPSERPFELLTTFFERIQRFREIHSLKILYVHLTTRAISQIYHGLPQLRCIEVKLGWIPTGTPESFVPSYVGPAITSFCLITSCISHEDQLKPWIPFLNPAHLRDIFLDCNFNSWDATSIPVFSHVAQLGVAFHASDMPATPQNFAMFLPKFPAMESLEIIQVGEDGFGHMPTALRTCYEETLPIFPALKSVMVPHTALDIFLSEHITNLEINSYITPPELLSALDGRSGLGNITSLHIHIDASVLGVAELGEIVKLFPKLARFRVRIFHSRGVPTEVTSSSIATSFLETLSEQISTHFPTRLTTFMLSWSINFYDNIMPAAPINLLDIRDKLVERSSSLLSLWLDGDSFFLSWCRSLRHGMLQQTCINPCNQREYDRLQLADEFWESA